MEMRPKMTKVALERDVKERFGMGLYEFVKQKTEEDALHDHEIAHILGVHQSRICKLRKEYGIKRANGFLRRFGRAYGLDAVETFKELVERPNTSLAEVGGHFGFTREYARHVYKKIYGRPYTEAYRRKRLLRQKKRLAEKRNKSKRAGALMKVGERMESLGLPHSINTNGNSYIISTNGYKLGFRISTTPTLINNREYFRINNAMWARDHLDFVVCVCRKGGKDTYFIIPSTAMPKALVSLMPEATNGQSKYAQFKEAWHLLDHKLRKETVSEAIYRQKSQSTENPCSFASSCS
jgi:methylphosphotriester-DNA--protein-cysteine methyltransferase